MTEDSRRPTLGGARVVLGVSGSIAAYKAVSLLRALVREGATVDVAMTRCGHQVRHSLDVRGTLGPAGRDRPL